ncbi:MAG: ABC transporter ATP-binding protein [Planctomycetota bacterium]
MKKSIVIKDLSFNYPDGSPALKEINLDIKEGESVGIIGPNGAGKSTLLLHLNGTLISKTGTVVIGNTVINSKTLKTIRKKVGMVFQNPDDQLFMPTVFDDIAFGLLNLGLNETEIRAKIKTALSRFGLTGFELKSPQHLSLGEKKKIALAGILVLEPEILVFDEPTADLDPRARREFITLIKNIPATRIIASHDLDMIQQLTQSIVILNHGKIAADGKTNDIISRKDILQVNDLI